MLRVKSYLPVLAVLSLSLGACATSRWSGGEIPPTSAASPSSPPAPERHVGTALEQEPPLPGDSGEGWPGLEEQSPSEEGAPNAH